ncbi:MAG: SprT-like domain-containing protein [Flavicella sp.]
MSEVFKYIPSAAIPKIKEYVEQGEFSIKISKKRLTKHGDFRRYPDGSSRISINENLNPQQFLLTLVHEIAHYVAYKKHGNRIKPHGQEWKSIFRNLMLPFVHPTIYKDTQLPHLAHYLRNPKASSDSDSRLSLALQQKQVGSDKNHIFEIGIGNFFILKGKEFKLLERKRTRYVCEEKLTKKKYLIHQNAVVTAIDE